MYWLQQAHDDMRLNRISQKLFDFVGKPMSDDHLMVIGSFFIFFFKCPLLLVYTVFLEGFVCDPSHAK